MEIKRKCYVNAKVGLDVGILWCGFCVHQGRGGYPCDSGGGEVGEEAQIALMSKNNVKKLRKSRLHV